ncbi:MAG: hypothetical protein HN742_24725 [Lentisphaerae bacterium]|jgi:hypothetical protein|nr:hypothetical protein [Lentisphaerota bacterium]MBT4823321.1 hypothetical protein [Lentisphaerota bacterium]MBT5607397.1 hypothetical protein [Lentisphaerota bacterium]MBT7054000.1 hypothetical protein [Lentisphaerota bacterium]MBT7845105.1 hypothetical protein [Lentisphaerota bacterium]
MDDWPRVGVAIAAFIATFITVFAAYNIYRLKVSRGPKGKVLRGKQLKLDLRRRTLGQLATAGSFAAVVLFQVLVRRLGLTEAQFYDKYPASPWIVMPLGLIFIGGLLYTAKKTIDTNPKIQLRSRADDVLESVLADPDCELWHREAQRLLDKRRKAQPGGDGR